MRILCLATIALISLAPLALAGDISGTITVPSLPTRPQPKPRMYDGKKRAAPARPAPAVVWIDGAVAGAPASSRAKAVVAQKDQAFAPAVLAVLKGTTVSFPNQDSEAHNIFSRSDAKALELGRYGPGTSKDVTFDKPGVVKLRCEIHNTMQGMILVMENPYFQVLDGSGQYTLKNVPAGTYKLVAYQEDCEPVEKTVQVPATGVIQQDFTLAAE